VQYAAKVSEDRCTLFGQTLRDLVTKKYVGSIPADPMTGSDSTWRAAMEDPAKSADSSEPGIFDVHSGSGQRRNCGQAVSVVQGLVPNAEPLTGALCTGPHSSP
jgi:hypothetical protein